MMSRTLFVGEWIFCVLGPGMRLSYVVVAVEEEWMLLILGFVEGGF
jgi:hypothetical protein